MSKDMLGSVVRAAVGVPQDRLEVLAKIASRMAKEPPTGEWHEKLKKLLLEGSPPVVTTQNLKPAGFIEVPGVAVFVAKKMFREGNGIYALSEDFKRSLLGVIEEGVAPATLRIQELQKGLSGEAVYAALDIVEIALAHFLELLKNKSTTFIIVRCHGQFLLAHWRADREGWFIDVSPYLNCQLNLEAGDRVVTYR